ncbi:energy-coupling factor ABC transporter ATP-binding protein [Caldimonas thermodepolymerans]|uniref:energy-coupling factor ABC transporter ATP-binding protein n=1 Tax=Caldimonas thermodepolymerans TaxID=215580 RepID=UPI002236BD15|nr:ABC transporter ATP-binding protein [Caldimonas thermodepolymerans]UZG44623.1 energy-coupling factor ABC transporter ATP-binding protein [Caldimonas thermodepolymerans]
MNAAAAPVLLRVEALRFRHAPRRPLLEDVTLALHAGERLGLAGANGSGKSTLLQVLMGLLPAQDGTIELLGTRCRDERDFAPLRGRVGLLFQDSDDQLFCPTVEEDVAFGPLNQGLPAAQVREVVARTLARLGLERLRERPIPHLSGGEKRLVALAGLLAMEPEVLLLDEPTTGLDERAQEHLAALLQALPQAMLVVSHDAAFLQAVTHRRLALRDGRLQPAPAPAARYSWTP